MAKINDYCCNEKFSGSIKRGFLAILAHQSGFSRLIEFLPGLFFGEKRWIKNGENIRTKTEFIII